VLAFSSDKVEDVTQSYTLQWDIVRQRRKTNKNNMIDFPKIYNNP